MAHTHYYVPLTHWGDPTAFCLSGHHCGALPSPFCRPLTHPLGSTGFYLSGTTVEPCPEDNYCPEGLPGAVPCPSNSGVAVGLGLSLSSCSPKVSLPPSLPPSPSCALSENPKPNPEPRTPFSKPPWSKP